MRLSKFTGRFEKEPNSISRNKKNIKIDIRNLTDKANMRLGITEERLLIKTNSCGRHKGHILNNLYYNSESIDEINKSLEKNKLLKEIQEEIKSLNHLKYLPLSNQELKILAT